MIEQLIRAMTCSPKNDHFGKTYADDYTDAPIRRKLQTYDYPPVTSRDFRLLVLHSGQFDDASSATLVHSSLDRPPEFDIRNRLIRKGRCQPQSAAVSRKCHPGNSSER
jgi:hypothetical protein